MKLKQVQISKSVLAEMFIKTGRAFQVIKGLPKTAELLFFNPVKDNPERFVAIFQDESFEKVKGGEPIPDFEVHYQQFEVLQKPKIILPGQEGLIP